MAGQRVPFLKIEKHYMLPLKLFSSKKELNINSTPAGIFVRSLEVWLTFSATFFMTRIFPATFDIAGRTSKQGIYVEAEARYSALSHIFMNRK